MCLLKLTTMTGTLPLNWIVFEGYRKIASGSPREVAPLVKQRIMDKVPAAILVFDFATGQQVDPDLRGTLQDVEAWAESVEGRHAAIANGATEPARRGPGRKKLGVVAREITLLPRHWEWLSSQPGGASAALRRLVDKARAEHETTDRVRNAREATYRFLLTVAGNHPGFEEMSRALFAGDGERFTSLLTGWPSDIVAFALRLTEHAFPQQHAEQ